MRCLFEFCIIYTFLIEGIDLSDISSTSLGRKNVVMFHTCRCRLWINSSCSMQIDFYHH